MKKFLLLLAFSFTSSILFSQNQPQQFNNECDDNEDGFASFFMQEIAFEIVGNNPDVIVTHHLTQQDAVNSLNSLPSQYTNITNPQLIFARIYNTVTAQSQIITYNLTVYQRPQATTQVLTNCADVTTSFPCWNLLSLVPQILNQSPNSIVSFFQTQSDAEFDVNPIINTSCYISPVGTPTQPPVYYRITDILTECSSVGLVELVLVNCGTGCESVLNFAITNVTSTTAVLNWSNSNTALEYEIVTFLDGVPVANVFADSSPVLLSELNCNAGIYAVYVRAICSPISVSEWSILSVTPIPCNQSGNPVNLITCVDTIGNACFDLTQNNQLIIGSLNPTEYTITYHASEIDAINDANALSSPYCISTTLQTIFSRLEDNATSNYQILVFDINVESFSDNINLLSDLNQCDENNDGSVIFDLTVAQAQIATTNALEYYTSVANAQNQTSPITNPASFIVSAATTVTPIFVREVIANSCDSLYTFNVRAFGVCNTAFICNQANSLCNSLGVPFSNTINSASNGTSGCLFTTPNPTWFYFPISVAGNINLQVSQTNNFGELSDVDYIVYGPFTDQLSPCNNPSQLLNNIVSCSYSAQAIEDIQILNAQPGEFYLLMVTNFSNQAGFITITQTGIGQPGQGEINCSGLRFNAFLDSNNNGAQDNGEQNFPLGQFQYEKNNDAIVHNITAPSGIYSIYDVNPNNTYDVSFLVNSSYASMYNVLPSSYNNLSTTLGSGMVVYNFPVTVVQSYNDIAITIVPLEAPRPGFIYQNKVIYSNLGNQVVPSGTITFNNDSNVAISFVSQSGTTPITNGFTYNFTNLNPFETRIIDVSMQIPVIPTVNAGQVLTNTASIAPLTGDVVTENNESVNSQTIINAYDPNDKMEAHGDRILHASFTSNDYLYYTIRFENTGTASAINIRVNDVLDSQLDETSIRMVNSSHAYELDRIGNNLTWKFDNIQLPVSVENTATGKGYIMFKVKPKSGYDIGDIITNTASIFFDYNPAIVTNTFTTEFVTTLTTSQYENDDFVIYPNPASDNITISLNNNSSGIKSVLIYDVSGKTILKSTNITSQSIDISSVNSGMYFIEITSDDNQKVVKKLIVE